MIPVAEPFLGEEELNNVIEAVKSSWISSKGKFIDEFERNFSFFCERKYGVATSNGTSALHLALKVLGIKMGDEVIVPNLTFVAVANVVKYCNAKPIFVDSHPDYWCIHPEKIEEKITSRTKAIIPVHLYGHPCDMDKILDIAKEHDLYIIEDCAEAHGAEYKGKKVGCFGDISCFSFYGNKIITTGEGGICLTNNEELAEKMRILRDHGMDTKKRYWYNVVGYNYRMTNLQAAIGVAQLTKINRFIDKKRKIAKWYKEGLKYLKENGLIILHPEMPWAKCVYWMYSIIITEKFGMNRDEFLKLLGPRGIETRPFFYPINTLPPYKNYENNLDFSESISLKGLNLPSSITLEKKEIDYIIDNISKIVEEINK